MLTRAELGVERPHLIPRLCSLFATKQVKFIPLASRKTAVVTGPWVMVGPESGLTISIPAWGH